MFQFQFHSKLLFNPGARQTNQRVNIRRGRAAGVVVDVGQHHEKVARRAVRHKRHGQIAGVIVAHVLYAGVASVARNSANVNGASYLNGITLTNGSTSPEDIGQPQVSFDGGRTFTPVTLDANGQVTITVPANTPADQVVLAGQAGLTGHLTIGSGVRIGAQAGVMADVPAGTEVVGSPAQPVSTNTATSLSSDGTRKSAVAWTASLALRGLRTG